MPKKHMAVGEVARRSGLAVSTLHFYERLGLIASERNAANHRVFHRAVLRRVSIIKVAQSVGLPLAEIAAALSGLPRDEAPTAADWERIAANWHADLTRRIEMLTAHSSEVILSGGRHPHAPHAPALGDSPAARAALWQRHGKPCNSAAITAQADTNGPGA